MLGIIIRRNSDAKAWLVNYYWFKVYEFTRDFEVFYLVQKVLDTFYSEMLSDYQLGCFVRVRLLWSSERSTSSPGPLPTRFICFFPERISGTWENVVHKAVEIRFRLAYLSILALLNAIPKWSSLAHASVLSLSSFSPVPKKLFPGLVNSSSNAY